MPFCITTKKKKTTCQVSSKELLFPKLSNFEIEKWHSKTFIFLKDETAFLITVNPIFITKCGGSHFNIKWVGL